ncbi:hypothetical protein LMG28727_07229 [Paraburkholderia kirstenboschensis]|uniref:hypothetical protein n=1 Tax=Paraburkholderia kirstenboschensis TaxID=1245436 RepID=UPI000FFC6177|nr:hypothetical protein [Paraburkholderia kirstenboschensis]CAD6560812.1 hypothetical protein LMG28727_07229 [Paraburkholderia kirstenboschensis]
MKRKDFVALTTITSILVNWAASVGRLGVKETDEIVVDTARPVALVVDECKKEPKASFMGEIKQLARWGSSIFTTTLTGCALSIPIDSPLCKRMRSLLLAEDRANRS